MPNPADKMDELARRWQETGDNRAIFADAYRTMTGEMFSAIGAGGFEDGKWVDRLLRRFAHYYFSAVDRFDADDGTCPPAWHEAFDSCRRNVHPLQMLFLGINAHINYDLAYAISDVLEDWTELDDGQRVTRRSDHDRVNEVIASTVDLVQSSVIAPRSPFLDQMDRLLGRFDEWAFAHLIADWREDVWDLAVQLVESPQTGRRHVEEAISERAMTTARLIHVF